MAWRPDQEKSIPTWRILGVVVLPQGEQTPFTVKIDRQKDPERNPPVKPHTRPDTIKIPDRDSSIDPPEIPTGDPPTGDPEGGGGTSFPHPASGSGEPVYPPKDKMLGHEGRVTLTVCVEPDGHASSVSVSRSSGYPGLDQAAIDWATRIRWVPAMRRGQAQSRCFDQPYRFRLSD